MTDGALLLDKPLGLSSNAALQQAKRLFGAKKAGHAGTLDPLASGLLLVLFGEATKFAGPLLDGDKEYLATLQLGVTTATGDAEGEVLERRADQCRLMQIFSEVLERFRGEIEQMPPMYSALKHDGVPLYKLARRGEEVERKPRRVTDRASSISRLSRAHSWKYGCVAARAPISARWRRTSARRSAAAPTWRRCGAPPRGAFASRTRSASTRWRRCRRRSASGACCRSRSCWSACRARSSMRRRLRGCATARRCRLPAWREGLCGVYGPGGVVLGLGAQRRRQPAPLEAHPSA